MSSLHRFLKRLRAAEKSGKRILQGGNSARGLEYNGINENNRVSGEIWNVDIARCPHIVRSLRERVDVHGEAWNANRCSQLIHYRQDKALGRGGGIF